MRSIYFIEIEGVKYYKTDSFWSKNKDFTHAKIHTDSKDDKQRFFTSLISGLKPYPTGTAEWDDEDWIKIQRWKGSLYGYQTVVSEGESDRWTLSEDSILSEPKYLKRIDSVTKTGEIEFSDEIVLNRDKKIDELLQK